VPRLSFRRLRTSFSTENKHSHFLMIDRATIDKIFEIADIVDVVSDYVTLKRRGVNYIGLCPFHNEKTPSFTVSPAKNICKCFGCGKGGNPVNFIMELENLSYFEALKFLAKKYHIEIEEKELSPEEIQKQNERESLMAVTEWSQQHFTSNLYNHVEGKAIGMSYFMHRGFREDIIKKFQLGYAIDKRDEYTLAAQQKGYKLDYLEKTGLTIVKDNNYVIDRFHGRAIFPIHSISGKVIAFGGRAIKKDDQVKYQNSPESEIYHKSQALYGVYFAKNAIIREKKCYIVEGYCDVISMVQAGIENIVAPCGTALTSEQIRLLRRILPSVDNDKNEENKNVTMMYDGDSAGINAALKNGKLLLEEGLNVKVVVLPPEDDPDTFAQNHNASDVLAYLNEHETDYIIFKTTHFLEECRRDPIKKAQLISDIANTIAVIPDLIKRSVYVKECARILETDEKIFYAQIDKVRSAKLENEIERIKNPQVITPSFLNPGNSSPTANNAENEGQTEPFVQSQTNQLPQISGCFYDEEKNIIQFVVKYGEKVMCEVEKETKTPVADKEEREDGEEEEKTETTIQSITVVKYIKNQLDSDGLTLSDATFKQMLDEAVEQISKNPNFCIERYFIYHENPIISKMASDLIAEPYQLSKIHTKMKKVETDTDRLFELVPHIVMDFKFKVISYKIKTLQEKLRTPMKDNELISIMTEIQNLQKVSRTLAAKLGEIVYLPSSRF